MKKALLVLTILFMVLINCNISFAFQNEPDGFRNLKFGMSIKQVEEVVGKDALERISRYDAKDKKDTVNQAYLLKLNPPMISNLKTDKQAEIHFFKDQLMGVSILLHGDKNKYLPRELIDKYNTLYKNMKLLYGMPSKIWNFSSVWEGVNTTVGISCTYNDKNMNYIDEETFKKLNEREKEAFRNKVAIAISSNELSKAQISHSFEEFKKDEMKKASQGW